VAEKSPMDGGKQNFAWPKAKTMYVQQQSHMPWPITDTYSNTSLTGSQIKRPGCSGYSGLFLYWQNVFTESTVIGCLKPWRNEYPA
jgi:hypothetical protein